MDLIEFLEVLVDLLIDPSPLDGILTFEEGDFIQPEWEEGYDY